MTYGDKSPEFPDPKSDGAKVIYLEARIEYLEKRILNEKNLILRCVLIWIVSVLVGVIIGWVI